MNVVVTKRGERLAIKKGLNQTQYDVDVDMSALQREAKAAADLEAAKRYYSASRLQGIVRGFLVRLFAKELRRELHALLTIQRVFRGKLGRMRWMREYWRSISVVKSPQALAELRNRSGVLRDSTSWTEYFDPLSGGFWYFERRSNLSTWNCPLIFQKTLVCNWDGFEEFGGAPSDKKCRCVFDNVAEYQGHIRTAHKWYCVSCFRQNSGALFPICPLCGNDKSEDGRDGEKALNESLSAVRAKMNAFVAAENVGKANFKYKIKSRLVELAAKKLEQDRQRAAEREEARRLKILSSQPKGSFGTAANTAILSGGAGSALTKKKKSERERRRRLEAANQDPWDVDLRHNRKNALRVTGCMIPALPLFNAEVEKYCSPFNADTSSVAEMAADKIFKIELGGIEGERKLFEDPIYSGKISAPTFDWITTVDATLLKLMADAAEAQVEEEDLKENDEFEQDQITTKSVNTQSLFDMTLLELDSAELGKNNAEHRLLVCDSFMDDQKCQSSTCPHAHPGIRDKAEIFLLRLPGRVKKVSYVKCCPEYTGTRSGCKDAESCPFYHVYIRPATSEIIRRIYPIEEGQKSKVLPSGAIIDGNLKNNHLSGYGVMTWRNGSTYLGDWEKDLRHGFGIYRTLYGTEYSGGWSEGKRHGFGVYVNELGEEYVGEWAEGKMHGVGRLLSANGSIYEGNFQNHKFHGVGMFHTPSGSKFTGQCVSGMASGLGIMILNTGEKYKGNFDRNFRHGKGACSYPNGSYYAGDWYRGVPTGFGIYIGPNGEKYVGQMSGGRKEGEGRYMFLDGSFYDGQFHKDKAKGVGVYYSANGDVFSGQWDDDKRNGRGTFRYANHSVYTGNWLYNDIHGKGKFDYASGAHYRGEFMQNKKHGKGIYTWPNGNEYKGHFVNDKLCGKGEMKYIGGHYFTGDWLDNKKHGQGTFNYVNGAVYSGQWERDSRHGFGKLTFLPGSFIEEYFEGEWENDEMHGKGTYAYRKDEGTVYVGDWVKGRRHGMGKISYLDGSYYKGEFQDDKMWGHGTYIGADGSQYTGQWIDNMRQGLGTMLAPDGSIFTGEYQHNMKHGHGKLQYPDGNIFEGEWQGNVIVPKEGMGMSGRFTFICGKGSRGGPEELTLKVYSY